MKEFQWELKGSQGFQAEGSAQVRVGLGVLVEFGGCGEQFAGGGRIADGGAGADAERGGQVKWVGAVGE
ncbi:hypothetical protein ACFXG4_49380 [Nocardia sp. NPDC059246]|uniref:hypothetical protein n=1 Tax=unclassified Nocardia TaxID=2637762 RepID=UPI0036A71D7C